MRRLTGALWWLACGSAVLASGTPADRWVPVRWPGGPLELLRRAIGPAPVEAAAAEALRDWYRPSTPVRRQMVAASGRA